MKTLKLNPVSKQHRLSIGVVYCLAITLIWPCMIHAAKHDTHNIQSRQLAEQIYHQISDRYSVKNYSFEETEGVFLATYYLDAGMVLTYNSQGHLVKRLDPAGYETHYQKGYPVKKVSPHGDLIWTIEYSWGKDNQVKRTIRHEGQYTTVSYYNDQGITLLETHESPAGLVFRYQFTRENHQIYSYFETNALTCMTDLYFVSAVTGLIVDHWRITGNVQQIWNEKYDVFMQQVLERFEKDYADRTQFKTDSAGNTRGDVLLKNLQPENILSLQQFAQYVLEKRIIFDDAWAFIDCSDVRIVIPVIELVESEKVLIQKAKVQGNQVMVWVKERLQWEVYPFDPREEELIPVNMRGDVRIESRYQKSQWRIIPGKQIIMHLSVRLIIPEIVLQKQREQLSQHLYDDPDFDDLFTVMQQAAKKPTPTAVVQTGEIITQFSREELDTFRIELAFQVKNVMQASPQLNQRDSFQKTQAELLLQILTPEKILSYEEFARQKDCLRRHRLIPFDKIEYSNLEIFTPEIEKKKLYKIINRVREKRGLQIWKEDAEHPDKGYWTPYALRPSRDKLIQENGHMVIQVDEGKFKWQVTPIWKGKIVSGEVYFAHPIEQRNLSVGVDGFTPGDEIKSDEKVPAAIDSGEGQRYLYLKAMLPTIWHGYGLVGRALGIIIQGMMQGQTGENLLFEKRIAPNQKIQIAEIRNWHGKILGYRRLITKGNEILSQATYNAKKDLLSMQSVNGDSYLVESLSPGEHLVIRYRGKEQQRFRFAEGKIMELELADKTLIKYTYAAQFTKIALYDRSENLAFVKVYNQQGNQVGLDLPDGEKVKYFYNQTKNILGMTLENNQGQEATLVLDQDGRIIKSSGNGKLVYFASKQLDFLKPDRFKPLKIEFQLTY